MLKAFSSEKQTDMVTVWTFKYEKDLTTPKHEHQKPINHNEGHLGHAFNIRFVSKKNLTNHFTSLPEKGGGGITGSFQTYNGILCCQRFLRCLC